MLHCSPCCFSRNPLPLGWKPRSWLSPLRTPVKQIRSDHPTEKQILSVHTYVKHQHAIFRRTVKKCHTVCLLYDRLAEKKIPSNHIERSSTVVPHLLLQQLFHTFNSSMASARANRSTCSDSFLCTTLSRRLVPSPKKNKQTIKYDKTENRRQAYIHT